MSDVGIIIPARFKSTRFPGKPLALLNGREMILHVAEIAAGAIEGVPVYVATDDKRIAEVCKRNDVEIVYTSQDCMTGTDRVAEAAAELGLKYVINVQGDEPMVSPNDIQRVFSKFVEHRGEYVVNGVGRIDSSEVWRSPSVPKVVFDDSYKIKYLSRSPIPFNKSQTMTEAFRQVCIYGFSSNHLNLFCSVSKKTRLEQIEDIELLRFLELGQEVLACEVSGASLAVDHPEDIAAVEMAIKEAG